VLFALMVSGMVVAAFAAILMIRVFDVKNVVILTAGIFLATFAVNVGLGTWFARDMGDPLVRTSAGIALFIALLFAALRLIFGPIDKGTPRTN